MEFFTSAVGTLQTLVIAPGVGLAVCGVIDLKGTGRTILARMGRSNKEIKYWILKTLR